MRAVALAAALATCAQAHVADAMPGPTRPNAEMAADILDLAFRLDGGREVAVLSRFEGPVRVRVEGPAPATLDADLDALLARLRDEAGLDVARGADAGVVIEAVSGADLAQVAPGAACFVIPGAASLAGFLAGDWAPGWTRAARRERALVVVPAGGAPQEVRDCLHEELAQALGPPGDLYRLPDSVFNDDNVHGVLTAFDMLALRALHDDGLSPGMTRAEVAARLPAILARLNPGGERPAVPSLETPPAWVEAIEAAFDGDAPLIARAEAAEAAVAITRAQGVGGARAGLALYALGRLRASTDPAAARAAFEAARAALDGPDTRIHAAHVEAQLAVLALARGDAGAVLSLTAGAVPVAEAHGDAALVALLLALRAEALEATGDGPGAEAARLDALPFARYGFDGPEEARARLAEVEALSPWRMAGET